MSSHGDLATLLSTAAGKVLLGLESVSQRRGSGGKEEIYSPGHTLWEIIELQDSQVCLRSRDTRYTDVAIVFRGQSA
jgi:hypothetical protein